MEKLELEKALNVDLKDPLTIADENGVSFSTVYRWIKKFEIQIKPVTLVCVECHKNYEAARTNGICKRQKFCSKSCNLKHFHKQNPDKQKIYNKRHILKQPSKSCVVCAENIPKFSNRRDYCSDQCAHVARLEKNHKAYEIFSKLFSGWKESISCQICGYNKCGGSLDLHHVKDKTFRITMKDWLTKSDRMTNELLKCALVCKNCHYEIHNGLIDNPPPFTRKQLVESGYYDLP